jgi:hypothetical protein
MGFLGLQTKNSNTMDKVSSEAKSSLFDKFGTSVDGTTHNGSLYQFNDGVNARENLHNTAAKDLATPMTATINKYVQFINDQTNGLFTNAGIDTAINNETNLAEKTKILLGAIDNTAILPDSCFGGYNKNAGSVAPTFELNYQNNSSKFIPDDGTGVVGSRVTVLQLNQ